MGDSPQNADGTLTVFGDTWARALAGVSPHQLANALQSCVASGDAWPPALPEFRAMCDGIPAFSAVRAELLPSHQGERSPFARLVWLKLDSWAYRHANAERAERILRDAYGEAVRHLRDGKPLPPSPVADLGHGQRQGMWSTPEVAEGALQAIAKTLGLSEQIL